MRTPPARSTRLTLQRWREIGRQGGASFPELGDEVPTVPLHHDPQLGGTGDSAGVAKASAISSGVNSQTARSARPWRVGPHGHDQHHVGQVDGLSPRRGADLHERQVDDQQLAVAHQQVGGLDVAMGEARVPQPADQQEPGR